MTYYFFIESPQALQIQRACTLFLPNSCSSTQIPNPFSPLFSNIIAAKHIGMDFTTP